MQWQAFVSGGQGSRSGHARYAATNEVVHFFFLKTWVPESSIRPSHVDSVVRFCRDDEVV